MNTPNTPPLTVVLSDAERKLIEQVQYGMDTIIRAGEIRALLIRLQLLYDILGAVHNVHHVVANCLEEGETRAALDAIDMIERVIDVHISNNVRVETVVDEPPPAPTPPRPTSTVSNGNVVHVDFNTGPR